MRLPMIWFFRSRTAFSFSSPTTSFRRDISLSGRQREVDTEEEEEGIFGNCHVPMMVPPLPPCVFFLIDLILVCVCERERGGGKKRKRLFEGKGEENRIF